MDLVTRCFRVPSRLVPDRAADRRIDDSEVPVAQRRNPRHFVPAEVKVEDVDIFLDLRVFERAAQR